MRMKSLFLIVTMLALIFAVLAAIPRVRGVTPTISVSPATNVYDPPQSFTIDIDISDVTDLYMWELKLRFDNQILYTNLTSIVEGGFLQQAGTTSFQGAVGPSLDHIILGCSLTEQVPGQPGSGTLASVTFTVKDTGSCTLHIYEDLPEPIIYLYDSAMGSISASTIDGEFHTTYYRPVAAFSYSPSPKAEIYKLVTFDASDSYDGDGTIDSYVWDFGDGNITETGNPTIVHNYTDLATYIITLDVFDNDEPPNTDSVTDSISVVLIGDINGDRKVDWQDLFVFARAYGSLKGQPAYVADADFNSDNKVDWQDLFVFARNYGRVV